MSYKILIVDDDREFREELSASLEEYDILEASDGIQALEFIKKPNAIDLVILDVVMPGENGIEIIYKIRKITANMNIIVLTGKSSKEIIVAALRAGANDYLEKPFEIDRLMEAIKRLLKNKSQNFSDISASGANYKIEKAKRFIEKNYDKRVRLSDVAAEICLSPKYLSRVFKEITGQGFNDYKLKIKTHKAEELLKSTPYTVDQISDKFGYKNLESFIRLFKKNTGITPAAYRKQRKKNAT